MRKDPTLHTTRFQTQDPASISNTHRSAPCPNPVLRKPDQLPFPYPEGDDPCGAKNSTQTKQTKPKQKQKPREQDLSESVQHCAQQEADLSLAGAVLVCSDTDWSL